jgi:hypothetical protein
MLFRILIVITAFIGILLCVETSRYLTKFKKDMSYFYFLINKITPFSFAIMMASFIPYGLTFFSFVICYILYGDISSLIEYFSIEHFQK